MDSRSQDRHFAPFTLKYSGWGRMYKYENGEVFMHPKFSMRKRLLEVNDTIYEFNVRVTQRLFKGGPGVSCSVFANGSAVLSINAEMTSRWWVSSIDKMHVQGYMETEIEDPLTIVALVLGFQDFVNEVQSD